MKKITVLLTKYSDYISWIVYHIGGRGYTHSSIALEGEDCYYSFNYRGFAIETLEKHKRRGVEKCVAYELEIPEADYNKIKQKIFEISVKKEVYSYTKYGLLLAILKIPYKCENKYFCSQFVAELLNDSGGIKLNRNVNTYLPNHFCKELNDNKHLKNIHYNVL